VDKAEEGETRVPRRREKGFEFLVGNRKHVDKAENTGHQKLSKSVKGAIMTPREGMWPPMREKGGAVSPAAGGTFRSPSISDGEKGAMPIAD